MTLQEIKKSLVNIFQGKLKNIVSLADDSTLEKDMKVLKVGEKSTPIKISEGTVEIGSTLTYNSNEVASKQYVSQNVRHLINTGFNYGFAGGTKTFVPLNGYIIDLSSTAGRNEYVAFVAPYDGYLNQVVSRSEEACGSTIVGLHISATGTEAPNSTASNTVTVDMAADDTSYKFSFGESASFDAGDILAISFDPTNDSNDTNCTVEFILDSSSGL